MTTAPDVVVKLADECGELVHSQCPEDVGYVLILLVSGTRLVNVTTNIEQRDQVVEVLRDYVRAHDRGVISELAELKPVQRKN